MSSVGTSGTFTCVIPELFGNTTFIARTYVHSVRAIANFFVFSLGNPIDFQGTDVMMELLMYSTLVLMMMSTPVLIIIGAILGMLMAVLLIFLGGSTMWTLISIIGYFIAAGFLIISHLGKRGGSG
jgi:hypothetical protein